MPIGHPIRRVEDLRLLTGRGRFTDDLAPKDALHGVVLRSPHAHARILGIDAAAARAMPGVIAVLTAAEAAADALRPMRHTPVPADALDAKMPAFNAAEGATIHDTGHPVLAGERVRHVGEAVAFVVAETLQGARDAAEAIEVAYEPLPAVAEAADALAPGAPEIWPGIPSNLCLEAEFGDRDATEAAFARAALVVGDRFVNQRIASCHMEPRSAFAAHDAARGVTVVTAGSQGAVRQRADLARALGVPIEAIDFVSPDTGGGFGSRTNLHPETLLVAWAARRLGRAVRWTATRSEGFVTDYGARDLAALAELALDAEGRILGFRTDMVMAVGAFTVSYVPLSNGFRVSTTVYRVPVAHARTRGALTNTVPTAPFRGAGRPEAMFAMERLLDMAARRLGLDRVEIRRRNLVPRAALPWRNPFGLTYDSGDFAGNMEAALRAADWGGFAARREGSAARGRRRGIGVANYVESPVGAPRERVVVRVLAEGRVEVLAGTQSTGQGHETTFAQVVAGRLGVPMEAVSLVTGDTRRIAVGGGTHSDRSMRLAGTLLVEASARVLEEARIAAAARLGGEAAAVTLEDGIARTPASNRGLDLFEIAAGLPGGVIERAAEFNGRMPAYPTGCAVCELEVEPETGAVAIVRYTSVDDVGQPINPMIVDGQVHGGIAQGAGQALLEGGLFDAGSGQAVGGSFMDYALPRAADLPAFAVSLAEDPTAGNPLRVKGGGEGGITPAAAAILNALADATGCDSISMPATPARVRAALEALP
ncbi:xanthine dehydrogenase family protein molybdopterin-binding subunit [Roseomonas sp. KE2513]|uniref:xanthine dehydrogenase family protein molybdopterin-binding subunit n=1 Tax=Roseomonas sp. KE2513 TaxID=2479202 RepID=UPI0018DF0C57|nr:xanthine dehydrogenase family protein molybdopterin-binding subunit [Roseomonas sp. KE2513]MBI0538205.1 xanthine dehydrogenase family protein molybdopterin-binding subunit [Roseomonas sp. KE2513]